MKRTRAIDLELLFRKGVRDEVRREALADLARLDKKPELRVLLDAITGPRRPRRRSGARASSSTSSGCSPSRAPAELAAVRGRARNDWRPAAQRRSPGSSAIVALIAADGGVDKAWALASKSAGSLRDLLDAMPADPRSRASGRPLSQGRAAARRPAEGAWRAAPSRRRGPTGATSGSSCPAGTDADARRGRGLQRRPQRRPLRQGHAEEHRLRRRRRAGDRRQHERHLTATAARPTPQENTANPWWEVDLGAELPDRLDRRLQPHRRRPRQAAQRLHPQGPRRRTATSSSRRTTCRPRARRRRIEVGGERRRGRHPPRGDERPDSRPRQGGRDVQGPRPVRRATTIDRTAAIQALQRIPAADWPADEAKPLLDACSPTSGRSRRADRTSPTRSTPCSSPTRWPRLLPRGPGEGRPQASWASWACG